ncbi:MAG: type II toxin-antitoxin system VapC family toxin [Tunicatimonas sp.]
MRCLLDTQAIIWMLENDPKLSKGASLVIKDAQNELYASIVSLWEMTIKRSLGKLNIRPSLDDVQLELRRIQIPILPIEMSHLKKLQGLAYHHKDPFDRLLISQALAESLTLISSDGEFKKYAIKVLW